jgi:hypothetical protein
MAAISIALACIVAAGCATGGSGQATPPAGEKPSSVVGMWEGETRASCSFVTSSFNRCNAAQKVTLTLIEDPSGLGGFYTCAYGNQTCYDMNETGKIVSARLDNGRLTARVAMPDGSSCIFSGIPMGNDIKGGYTCFNGGAMIERGVWQGRRSY